MLRDACKVKTMLKEHKDLNFRRLEACTTEGNSITATQTDALHGKSRTLSGIMLLVVLVQLSLSLVLAFSRSMRRSE
jgi:hypothetical protein